MQKSQCLRLRRARHEVSRMHVDLVEALRCPNAHEEGWLVASADVMVERRIIQGVIGCPQCGAEWRVRDGALSLGSSQAASALERDSTSERGVTSEQGDTSDQALRLAALLDLRDARGAVVLSGSHTHFADALAALTGVLVLAVNPPGGEAEGHSRLFASRQLPLGVGTVRGVMLDAAHGDAAWVASAVRAVERGGRIVAPAIVSVPPDVTELARDGVQWVGEVRVASSGLVPLRRSGVLP